MSKNYVSLFEYAKAEEICLEMLNDRNALDRDEYVSVDKVWQTLGKIYRKQKLYDKAEQILLQALAYGRTVYGENSRVCKPGILCLFLHLSPKTSFAALKIHFTYIASSHYITTY